MYICLSFFIFKQGNLLALSFTVLDLEKFISSKLIIPEKVSCLLMLAAIGYNVPNPDFFSLCKTANFRMSVVQKLAGKSHTSPGKKFAEQKGVSDSSTTFICRVTVPWIFIYHCYENICAIWLAEESIASASMYLAVAIFEPKVGNIPLNYM